jgi:ArsR family transcriptional regulator, arsenate/arsenite/antimonite-responsive transcriptional repressor
MESKTAIEALSALAHEGRLSAFRTLVRAGDEGLPAGDLARVLNMPPNSLSTNLGILARAGLVTSRRDGRSVIYAADYDGMASVITFLMKDCCQGRAEVCAPVSAFALSPEKQLTGTPA